MVFGSAAGDPTLAPWALPEAQGGWGYAQALAQAQAWLAEAGYPGGVGLPPLTLLHNAADRPTQTAEAIARMWRAGLGVEVVVESRPWRDYWSLLNGDAPAEELPHIWRMGFCGDLPDQHGWLHQEFSTGQGADRLRWADDANAPLAAGGRSFNQLTSAAQQSADPTLRRSLYQEAERILSDTAAAYVPLYYYTNIYLSKPYVQRTFYALSGNRFETWTIDWPAK
jgi:oligopeptide transport system substrate-binding protein